MTEIRKVPSSMFRLVYATLEEPVSVTVNGHVIGTYTPAVPAPRSAQQSKVLGGPSDSASSTTTGAAGRTEAPGLAAGASPMTQAERDKVLRRVNRTGNER